jgi:hypothetical protein
LVNPMVGDPGQRGGHLPGNAPQNVARKWAYRIGTLHAPRPTARDRG